MIEKSINKLYRKLPIVLVIKNIVYCLSTYIRRKDFNALAFYIPIIYSPLLQPYKLFNIM